MATDDLTTLLDDLEAEYDVLDGILRRLLDVATDAAWHLATPAAGWNVHDQVRHLALSDAAGVLAATQPDAFEAAAGTLLRGITARRPGDEASHAEGTLAPSGAEWREGRTQLIAALRSLPCGTRLPWFGPPMGVRSFATARLMETWAHGLDIATTLEGAGLATVPAPSDRLRHVCHLGFVTRGWSYTVRGLVAPASPVRVELRLPSGVPWEAGDGEQRIDGDAFDFCRVVTQRAGVADTALVVTGPDAAEWMGIAQCFAGRASLAR